MRRVEFRPGIDDRQDLGGRKIGKGEVVRGRECNHVTLACDWFGAKEEGVKAWSSSVPITGALTLFGRRSMTYFHH